MMILKKILIGLCAVVISIFCIPRVSSASTEVDALLKLLVRKGVVSEQEAEELRGEVKKETAGQPVVWTSNRPVKAVKFGGKLEIRYEDSQGEEPSFKMTNFEPNITVDVNEHFSIKGKMECTTDTAFVNEGYAKYSGLPAIGGDGQVGKFRRASFGLPQAGSDRVSIDYSLLARAFTGERQLGAEYNRYFKKAGLLGPVKLVLGIFNGGDVGNREAGDNAKSQVLFIADRAGDTDDTQNKEFCFRSTIEPVKGLQIGGSMSAGKLSAADLSTLNTYLGTLYSKKKKERFGADISYKFKKIPMELRYEYMHGKTSGLGLDSWYAMWILRDIGKSKKLDLYARYSSLDPDISPAPSSYTWDLNQATLGAIWNFNKMTRLQGEYEFNGEEPGAGTGKVDNDMLRIEWQTDF
ncbi:MAG: hypothetical protein WC312_05370 [Candidatus Omnitrophota bacterium]|jgi:hypothetical protein